MATIPDRVKTYIVDLLIYILPDPLHLAYIISSHNKNRMH